MHSQVHMQVTVYENCEEIQIILHNFDRFHSKMSDFKACVTRKS